MRAVPIVSVKPVVIPAAHRETGGLEAEVRGTGPEVRISAPVTGQNLPIVLFAHGFGSSLNGYGPLTDYWAAHGFVVVQPTHPDSRTLGVTMDDPRLPGMWRTRVADLKSVLDHLDLVEAAVPGLAGRLDRDRIAVAGHSFGGQTAGNLLGLKVVDPNTGAGQDYSDPRVRAGVLLATAGRGGADLTPYAAEHLPFMNPDFSGMHAPALIVAGERDDSPLSHRGPD